MKKVVLFFALVSLFALASCNDSKDAEDKTQFQQEFYNRVINNSDNQVLFSKSIAAFTINFSAMQLDVTHGAKLAAGLEYTMQATGLKLTYDQTTGSYTISMGNAVVRAGNNVVTAITGRVDIATGVIFLSYLVNNTYAVYATTPLGYAYGTLSTTYTVDGADHAFDNEDFAILVAINDEGTTARVTMYNVQLKSDMVSTDMIVYDGVAVKPTLNGYELSTEASLKPVGASNSDYDMTGFEAHVDQQGRVIAGKFAIGDVKATFTAGMFSDKK